MTEKYKIWYIPQIPMPPWELEIDDLETAKLVLNSVIDFSIFEYVNRVKPDYADVAGISRWEEDGEGGFDWFELDEDEWREEAAFAVFEGAYTPSDDEREALARAIHDGRDHAVDGTPLGVEPLCNCYTFADKVLTAGFRRTVQGDAKLPQNSVQGEHQKMVIYDGNETVCVTCPRNSYGEYVAWDQAHPQGEPGLRAHVRNLTGATDAELDVLGGFQGEPSDAQADAARIAFHEFCFGPNELLSERDLGIARLAWKAALRAAAETGGER